MKMLHQIVILFLTWIYTKGNPISTPSFTNEYQSAISLCSLSQIESIKLIPSLASAGCNFAIPEKVPSLTNVNPVSVEMHLCMGLLDTVMKLCAVYKSKPDVRQSLETYFAQPLNTILSILNNKEHSSKICNDFSNTLRDGNSSITEQWMHNLKRRFESPEKCKSICVDGQEVSNSCLFIYGINTIINNLTMEAKTTQPNFENKLSVKNIFIQDDTGLPGQKPVPVQKQPIVAEKITDINIEPPEKSASNKIEHKQSSENKDISTGGLEKRLQAGETEDIIESEAPEKRFETESTSRATTKVINNSEKTGANVPVPQPMHANKEEMVKPPAVEKPAPNYDAASKDLTISDNTGSINEPQYDDLALQENKNTENLRVNEKSDKTESNLIESKIPETDFVKRMEAYKSGMHSEMDADVSLMPWYLMVVFCIFLIYLSFINKKKIVAYVVEGRPGGGRHTRRGRPSTANYRKLDSNLEEAITSNCSTTTTSHVIY